MDILEELRSEKYRIGDLQALRYTPGIAPFQEGYLSGLYFALGAGRRTSFRRENLQMLFCGMRNLSHDAIVSYLAQQKLVILGKWEGDIFRTAGVCWPHMVVGEKEKSAFGAYGFLRWVWGTDDQEVLSYLGLAFLFREFDLSQMHGQRYPENHFTARWMDRFGFRDLCMMPKLLIRGESLVGCIISTCSRADFVARLEEKILAASL